MSQSNIAINLENISKEFAGVPVLNSINLSVTTGSIHGLLGPNGAGKSTTMNIITGLLKATSGKIKLFDQPINGSNNRDGIKDLIGYMPEHLPLYMDMKGIDYLKFIGKIYNLDKSKIESQLDYLVEKIKMGDIINRMIGNLSKGQKQRIGLSAAMIFNPKILILDEPTAGLDPAAIIEFRDLITELKSEHTILLSTHQLHEASLLCDEVTIINRGRIAWSGSIFDLHQNSHKKSGNKIKVLIELSEWNEDIKKELFQNSYVKNIELVKFEENELESIFLDLTQKMAKGNKDAKVSSVIN